MSRFTSDLATETLHVQTYVDDVTMSRFRLKLCSLINIHPGNTSKTSANTECFPESLN